MLRETSPKKLKTSCDEVEVDHLRPSPNGVDAVLAWPSPGQSPNSQAYPIGSQGHATTPVQFCSPSRRECIHVDRVGLIKTLSVFHDQRFLEKVELTHDLQDAWDELLDREKDDLIFGP